MKGLMRKTLVVTLCVMMTFVFSVSAAFAGTGYSEKTINYVALGDSMSQGYKFLDYKENYSDVPNQNHAHGFAGSSDQSSIKLFYDYLNKYSGKRVQMTDLSVQGLQPDEIVDMFRHLDTKDSFSLSNEADFDNLPETTKDHFNWWAALGTHNSPICPGNTEEERLTKLAELYVDAIKNADVITYDIGINYFGSYFTDNIARTDYKDDYIDLMRCLSSREKAEAKALRSKLVGMIPDSAKTYTRIIDVIMYSYLAYIVYTDECIERIYEVNPDVDIVLVGLYNTLPDLKVDISGIKNNFSKILDAVMDSLNFYASNISKYAEKYSFADLTGYRMASLADEAYYNDISEYDANLLNNLNRVTLECGLDVYCHGDVVDSELIENNKEALAAMLPIYKKAMSLRVVKASDLTSLISRSNSLEKSYFEVESYTDGNESKLMQLQWFLRMGSGEGARSFGMHPGTAAQKEKYEAIRNAYIAKFFGLNSKSQAPIRAAKKFIKVLDGAEETKQDLCENIGAIAKLLKK